MLKKEKDIEYNKRLFSTLPANSMTTKETLDYITDVFTGADGGISFLKFRLLLEALDKKSEAGDKSAMEILEMVTKFRKLIDIAQIMQ